MTARNLLIFIDLKRWAAASAAEAAQVDDVDKSDAATTSVIVTPQVTL